MAATHYKRPESVLVVIYTAAGEVLLLQRREPADFWQSVTGSLHWDETPAQAAQRELAEETGLSGVVIEDCQLQNRYAIVPPWRPRYDPAVAENIEHVFRVVLPERCAVVIAPQEHAAFRWIPWDEALRLVSSVTNRAAILELMNGESRVPGSEEKPGHGDLATRHPPPATVVLVHGLWMNGMEMCLLRRRLGKAGFATQRFSYPTVRSDIAANAARLQQFLSGLDADTVHFVGHSLGGLLILRLFADFPEQRPGRIVLLGTPYAGSATAHNLARRAWGRRLLGRSLEQALLGDGPRWHGGHDLGVIAGTTSMGLGLLVGELPRPNDGTVIVAETQGIPGAVCCTLPGSHSSLLFSADVAQRVCQFLRSGRFDADSQILTH